MVPPCPFSPSQPSLLTPLPPWVGCMGVDCQFITVPLSFPLTPLLCFSVGPLWATVSIRRTCSCVGSPWATQASPSSPSSSSPSSFSDLGVHRPLFSHVFPSLLSAYVAFCPFLNMLSQRHCCFPLMGSAVACCGAVVEPSGTSCALHGAAPGLLSQRPPPTALLLAPVPNTCGYFPLK